MASSDSQINKPQRGRPKRAELPDVNINTGAQSIDSERASLRYQEKMYVTVRCQGNWSHHSSLSIPAAWINYCGELKSRYMDGVVSDFPAREHFKLV